MKTSYDIDKIVYDLLISSDLRGAISGGIYYQGDRPDGSTEEDVVINTIALTQDYLPQTATSNINIYVSDQLRRINGVEQWKPNHSRLAELSKLTLNVLRGAKIVGMMLIPETQSVLKEESVRQHFCNIRIAWNIQTS